jgi:hypothetical protein
MQAAVASGGGPGGFLHGAEHWLQGRRRSRIQHDRPGVVQDPAERDLHGRHAGQEPARVIGHVPGLARRDLVCVPGDQGGQVQPLRRYQVQAAQAGQPFLADAGQLGYLRLAGEQHEPDQPPAGRVLGALRRPVILHLRRERAQLSSSGAPAGDAAAVSTAICSRISRAQACPANLRWRRRESMSAR